MKNICILGGGHGVSRLIKGFKGTDNKIDIIVTSSDNGGHTGAIIKEFEVPALGDLRMVLESVVNQNLVNFFSYRFKNLHGEENVSLGNLMLLSMALECGDINKMLVEVNTLIDDNITLHLSNNKYIELKAITKDENVVNGEVNIGECENIKDIYLENDGVVDDRVIDAITNADIIVLSFGSFYTSLGAVISSEKIKEAIRGSKAQIVYIPNLVNQKETYDYLLEDYVDFLEMKLDRKIDRVLISNSKIKRKHIKNYRLKNRKIVLSKEKRDNYEYYPLLVIEDEKLRHNVEYLAQIITRE